MASDLIRGGLCILPNELAKQLKLVGCGTPSATANTHTITTVT